MLIINFFLEIKTNSKHRVEATDAPLGQVLNHKLEISFVFHFNFYEVRLNLIWWSAFKIIETWKIYEKLYK